MVYSEVPSPHVFSLAGIILAGVKACLHFVLHYGLEKITVLASPRRAGTGAPSGDVFPATVLQTPDIRLGVQIALVPHLDDLERDEGSSITIV